MFVFTALPSLHQDPRLAAISPEMQTNALIEIDTVPTVFDIGAEGLKRSKKTTGAQCQHACLRVHSTVCLLVTTTGDCFSTTAIAIFTVTTLCCLSFCFHCVSPVCSHVDTSCALLARLSCCLLFLCLPHRPAVPGVVSTHARVFRQTQVHSGQVGSSWLGTGKQVSQHHSTLLFVLLLMSRVFPHCLSSLLLWSAIFFPLPFVVLLMFCCSRCHLVHVSLFFAAGRSAPYHSLSLLRAALSALPSHRFFLCHMCFLSSWSRISSAAVLLIFAITAVSLPASPLTIPTLSHPHPHPSPSLHLCPPSPFLFCPSSLSHLSLPSLFPPLSLSLYPPPPPLKVPARRPHL